MGLEPNCSHYLRVAVVDNRGKKSYSDEIARVTEDPKKPTAVAGENRTIEAGQPVTFDASKSYDPEDRKIEEYKWNFLDKTSDVGAVTDPPWSDRKTWEKIEDIKFTYPGDYEVRLQVKVKESGEDIWSDPDTAKVWVTPKPPVVDIYKDEFDRPEGSPYSITLYIDSDGADFAHADVCWYSLTSTGRPGNMWYASQLDGKFITDSKTAYTIGNLTPDQLYVFRVDSAFNDAQNRTDNNHIILWGASTEVKQKTDIPRHDFTFVEWQSPDPQKQIRVTPISPDTFKFDVTLIDQADSNDPEEMPTKDFKVRFSYASWEGAGSGVIDQKKIVISQDPQVGLNKVWIVSRQGPEGEDVIEKEIELPEPYTPGTPIPLSINWTPPGDGIYEIHAEIDPDNDYAERVEYNNWVIYEPLEFTTPPHLDCECSQLAIPQEEVPDGGTIRISTIVSNKCEYSGSYVVVLRVNDYIAGMRTVELNAGESKEVTFEISEEIPGTYAVDLEGQKGSFTVKEELDALTISSTAGGSVTTPGEGPFTYNGGTVVNLVATPDAGYRFVNWTGDVSTIADVEDAATTITMQGNYEITANFEEVSRGCGCFIATAAYGTPMADEIEILREFRDEYLLTNPLGKGLVEFYYTVSPPMADFVNEHPSLKPIVKAGLLPAVVMSAVAVNTTVPEKIAIIGLLVLASVALAVWAKRRRHRGPLYI
jgi:hypothetical protein